MLTMIPGAGPWSAELWGDIFTELWFTGTVLKTRILENKWNKIRLIWNARNCVAPVAVSKCKEKRCKSIQMVEVECEDAREKHNRKSKACIPSANLEVHLLSLRH